MKNVSGILQSVALGGMLCICFNNNTCAQRGECAYSASGKIVDLESKEPIPFVTVQARGTHKVTLTDERGEFVLKNLCDSLNTLVFSCIGYCDTICESDHHHDASTHIYLTQKVTQLDRVTIKAETNKERGTKSISQISLQENEIKRDLTQTLASAISDQQGVTFTSIGTNIQLPVIHGLYGNRILVLNNGFKHGFQNWGTDHAPEIDIASADKITIIKGAAGVRYGPEALGGAISVENNPLNLNNPFTASVTAGYQTNGRGYFVNPQVSQGTEHFSYYLGGNYTRIGDRHAPDYSLTNSGKKEMSFNGGIRYHLKSFDFKIQYSYLDQNLAQLRTSIAESARTFNRALESEKPIFIRPFSYDINEPNQLAAHHLGKVEANWWYSEDAKITFRYGRQFNQRQEFDVRRNVELPIIDLDLETEDYQLEWKHPDWFSLDGLIGFQYFTQLNDNNPGTQVTPFVPNYKTSRYSGFVVESKTWNRNTMEFGARFDYERNTVAGRQQNQDVFRDQFTFTNVTASLGYVRQVSDNSTFRTNLGSAWRTPNMAELYSFGQHGFKVTYGLLRYRFNEEGRVRTDRVLKLDDSSVELERGFKWINEYRRKIQDNVHTATFYINYIENFVYEAPLGVFGTFRGPMPAFVYRQDDALFVGFDYSWERDWTRTLSGIFGISYLWSQNVEKNETLINQPPVSTSYKLTWTKRDFWILHESNLSIRPSYTFKQWQAPRTVSPTVLASGTEEITANSEIFDFADAPEGYFLLELSWNCQWNGFSLNIAVNNVFDIGYRDYLNEMRYFADEPGRNFLFTLNYTFTDKERK
ncbi:MAG: TonB-dependent receptor [Flavobacteriales bacterium]|nr:TonB-dependent receptor [Flavobacteriales bacterium]